MWLKRKKQKRDRKRLRKKSLKKLKLSEKKLENFRREHENEGGLSSYPHPYLMPDYWQFATVSMGLGPIMAIYQARFMRYMIDRSFMEDTDLSLIHI